MKNAGAVLGQKIMHAVGGAVLEVALCREGMKGCSSVLCTAPVALEPQYDSFDSDLILSGPREQEPRVVPRQRLITLELFPGADDQLTLVWMEEALRSLAVLEGPFAFEVVGSEGRIAFRFALPQAQLAGFRTALLGTFPELVLRHVPHGFPRTALATVQEFVPVGPYHRSLTLVGREGVSVLSLVVQALHDLPFGAVGLFQVLLCPTLPDHDWHYNVRNLLEAEHRAATLSQLGGLSTHFRYDGLLPPLPQPRTIEKIDVDVGFYALIIRSALWTTVAEHATAFDQQLRVAMGMVRFGNRAFRVLSHAELTSALGNKSVQRLVRQRQTHRPGLTLTNREVATCVHLPNARALSLQPTVAQRRGLRWHPLATGIGAAVYGTNEYAGTTQTVTVPLEQRGHHSHVSGTTGHGKSVLLENIVIEDAYAGMDLCCVDPAGDLCLDVLSRLPEKRLRDFVYVSFGEKEHVLKWNPFAASVPPGKLADDITRAFLSQSSTRGPRMEGNVRMLSYTVAELKGTFEDFAELAGRTPRGELLRRQALDQITNPQVQRFLSTDLPSYGPREMDSVTNKLSPFLLDPNLGCMFSQRENTLDPRTWMDQGKIVLVNLSAGHIGTDHARFVGSLLVSLIYRAAVTRADIPRETRRPFLLVIDEFQNLQAALLSELLSEGRKYKLAALLAHQERGQLSKDLRHALGNCGTKIVFRQSEDDLHHAKQTLGSAVDNDMLRHLGVGKAFIACGTQVASLTTHLCARPRLRDPRQAINDYVAQHYLPIADARVVAARKPRVYDSFGGAGS